VEGFDSERRRIERDLHDGLQPRLLALSVTLGLARLALVSDGQRDLPRLLADAHAESKTILDQLRDLVRGIHPWLLTARGLSAAVADLAARSTVPVSTDIRLDGRLSQLAESTAYYVISEALANVDKHSGARQATVTVGHDRRTLALEIRDDGHGGADPTRGTGLQGLADRADAANARLLISSPPGGPTVLRLEVPCQRLSG
jgi:signal transduction histidine kinase